MLGLVADQYAVRAEPMPARTVFGCADDQCPIGAADQITNRGMQPNY
jgi:hypothetical protein